MFMRARIDTTALMAAADRFAAAADVLGSHAHLPLAFGASSAGRAHAAAGEAVRLAGYRLIDDVGAWARASAGVATALRVSADRYAATEAAAAARLG